MRQPFYESPRLRIWTRMGKAPLVEERQAHPVGGPAYASWQTAILVGSSWELIRRYFPDLKVDDPVFRQTHNWPYAWRIYSARVPCRAILFVVDPKTTKERWYHEAVDELGIPIRTGTEPAPAELLAHIAGGGQPLVHNGSMAALWSVLGEFPLQAPELDDD